MWEFYGYVTELLEDAHIYANHASRPEIEISDISLALMSRLTYSFQQPPQRELLLQLAGTTNTLPIPTPPATASMQLPYEEYCLVEPNYQMDYPDTQIPSAAHNNQQLPQIIKKAKNPIQITLNKS
ncbi:Transcription initiation factor TFIID subunit 9 [Pelomyxa schiedti]|nr:Transcription initiation factor TFIID subunit 9 [Pelomyxa schiedti]